MDFLNMDIQGKYDIVIVNPPFDKRKNGIGSKIINKAAKISNKVVWIMKIQFLLNNWEKYDFPFVKEYSYDSFKLKGRNLRVFNSVYCGILTSDEKRIQLL